MGDTKLSFKRYEKKYLLSARQYEHLRRELDPYIEPDEYFESTVCSVYYDNENYDLIRQSIEAPVYKEKLRLRSYNVPGEDDLVFVELKKKYRGVVYKRRVGMTNKQAMAYLAGRAPAPEESQMTREIDWFMKRNSPTPKAFIACDRQAYRAVADHELRVTFDENIRWRRTELDLSAGSHGELLIQPGQVLMEVKIPEAAPLWLARMFSEQALFPGSFSKYGVCYKENILKETAMGGVFHA